MFSLILLLMVLLINSYLWLKKTTLSSKILSIFQQIVLYRIWPIFYFFVAIPLLVSVDTDLTCLFSTTDFIDFTVSFPKLYSSALAVLPVATNAIMPPRSPNTNIQAIIINIYYKTYYSYRKYKKHQLLLACHQNTFFHTWNKKQKVKVLPVNLYIYQAKIYNNLI